MKIKCSKKDLLKGIETIETAVSSKTTLPILSNFLFETEKGKMKFAATDLQIGVKCFIESNVNEKASITIPVKKFSSLIKELSDKDEIELKIEETQVDINSARSHFTLVGAPKEDFPNIPDFDENKSINVESNKIKEMIKKTSFAISTDETRAQMTGIYFVIENNKIKLVATDGRRLCIITKDCKTDIVARAIVPIKAIDELLHILNLTEGEDNLKISISENKIGFKIKNVILISRLIEGDYPNYEQVIPKKNSLKKIKISRENLLSATKQMALITAEKIGAVKFLFAKNILRLSANTQGVATGETDVDIDFEGPNFEIAFNPEYLIDILKNFEEKEVGFEMNGPIDVVKIVGENTPDYLTVIMPVRLV